LSLLGWAHPRSDKRALRYRYLGADEDSVDDNDEIGHELPVPETWNYPVINPFSALSRAPLQISLI